MKEVIELSIIVKCTTGELWHALTDSDELENWWGEDIKLQPKVGGSFREEWQDDDGNDQVASGKVLSVKDKKEITFTWKEKDWPRSAVTECKFTIGTKEKKSFLTVKHSGWETLPEDRRAKVMKDFKVGWQYHLKELKEYLDF
ncbi:SRPBCC family protein [Bdellovibrio reynosensis]|uniref:SRPBCC domain-containing protein n=1 Tax=Bdellovibrio reynosensis TaxID=2835041 RepID=A0ABY4CAK3_9BACT|nr:SRPBCC domain-containing protein [Bdellovibrio reynosensis]UOF00716.1 SRPBCC domain-containing protein [Bdellovibrio reynosensis]